MNGQIQPQEQDQAYDVQAQWVQYIMPAITGVMMMVFTVGMIRDLIKGKKVELPK